MTDTDAYKNPIMKFIVMGFSFIHILLWMVCECVCVEC